MAVYGKPETNQEITTDAIIIDAGTGIFNLRKHLPSTVKKIHILLSHLHLDHIQGLLMLPEMFNGELEIVIYCGEHEEGSFEEHFRRLMQPPIWPCTPDIFSKKVSFLPLPKGDFLLGDVAVSTMQGAHPNGIDIFKLTFQNGHSLVHVGDYEVGVKPDVDEKLREFAKNADIILMDGMYAPEEYESRKGFGHSSWDMTANFAASAEAKKLKIIHHAPDHTDAILLRGQRDIMNKYPNVSFAREGEVLEI